MDWKDIINDPQVHSYHSYHSEKRVKRSFIIHLSPYKGGFYERLVGTTKMALKISIGMMSTACDPNTITNHHNSS